MKIKYILFLLFYGIILAFAGVITYRIFDEIFLNENDSFRIASVGAFLGAFFAFLFIRISDFFLKISTRINNNYKSLVRLQHYCNENLSMISDNILLTENIISQFTSVVKENKRIISTINIVETPINRETLRSITKIDLANQLFSYNMRLRKLNQSTNTLKHTYEDVRKSFTSKNITFDTYKLNVEKSFLNNAIDLKKYMVLSLDETKNIFSTVRVLGKNKPFIVWLFQTLRKNLMSKKQIELIPIEKNILEKEITQIQNESKDELRDLYDN